MNRLLAPSPAHTPALRPGHRHPHRRWARLFATAWVLLAVLALTAGSASAAPPPGPSVLALASSLEQVLDNLRNWLIGILAGLATVCLTVAGARYLIGGGDPAEMEKAKTALRAACVGYALAMLAPVVVAVLKSIVGA
ncbi:pilin [Nocardia bovistercoris]|uniref:TrbC/VirB2 family protein n=1 Tax=Nocardia bovistercoris TaxID=2785916 RepID=A0A931N0U9_9NOCA|nr:pilin [Nocardia bovistercoris]MBH0777680.1 TrbC/VirB2 family protein [Nocardia bovistercoris]